MAELYLPVLSHFQNGNFWTASDGRMRYRVDPEEDNLAAQVWEGPWGYEFSTVEEKRYFPLSEEGLKEIAGWAEEWSARINARPARTLEETIAMRDAVLRQKEAEKAGDGDGDK